MSNNVFVGTGLLVRFEERVVGQKGNRVASLSMVISKPRKKNPQTGQYENQEGTFVDVESWNVSPNLVNYLGQNQKNCMVTVVGRLEMDRWQDAQSGAQRSKLKVVAESIAAKPKPARRDGGNQGTQAQASAPATQAAPPASETVNASGGGADEDIPF
jgi:single-strand DNA-binding protein